MWEGHEGKYFKGKDFYDWGTDNDILKVCHEFQEEYNFIEEILRNENKKSDKYIKMMYLYLYTIADECFAKVYKAICIYSETYINSKKIRASYEEISKIENKTDLIDLFIDGVLNSELTGVNLKIREINKLLKEFYEFAIDKRVLIELEIFNIKRNALVHNGGKVNRRILNSLQRFNINYYNIDELIRYTEEEVESAMKLLSDLLWYMHNNIVEFYEQGFKKGINEEIKQINKELGNI